MLKKISSLFFLVIIGFSFSSFSETSPKKEKVLPKSGVLATVGYGLAGGGVKYDDAWGGVEMNDNSEPIPITASVTKTASGWKIHVSNNSPDPYSANLEFKQWDKAGTTLGRDSFSATLRSGSSNDRTIAMSPGAVGAQLFLANWKNLAPPRKEKEKEEAEVTAQ